MSISTNDTPFLKLLSSSESRIYPLDLMTEVAIGREPSCQIVLDSAQFGGVSRRHAAVRPQPGGNGFEIYDLGSANGTYVNGQRIDGYRPLQAGDRIRLGVDGPEFSFENPALVQPTIIGQGGTPAGAPATIVRDAPAAAPPPPVPPAVPPVMPVPNMPQPSAPVSPASPFVGVSGPAPAPGVVAGEYVATAHGGESGRGDRGNKTGLLIGGAIVLLIAGGWAISRIFAAPNSPITQSPGTEQAPVIPGGAPGVSPQPAQPDSGTAAPNPATGGQTYQDPNGLFQISLPPNYTVETTSTGIVFRSADSGFVGSVDVIQVDQQLPDAELEEGVKQRISQDLSDVTWQGTSVQPDGSLRIDWVGRTSDGVALDAVTFIEQRGSNVFWLDLFGSNRAFNDYASDAETIISSYQVRQS